MKAKIIGMGLVILLMGLILPGCAQGQISELKAQVAEQQAQIAELENQIAALNSTVEARDARIAELEENAKLTDAYKSLQRECWLQLSKLVPLERQLKESKAELEECKATKNVAKIEISFDPNPVTPKDNAWRYTVILTEVSGSGIYLKEIKKEEHAGDHLYRISIIDNESKRWNKHLLKDLFPPEAYLQAFGSLNFKVFIPLGSVTSDFTHCVFTVVGVDDVGREVRAEGKIDLIQ